MDEQRYSMDATHRTDSSSMDSGSSNFSADETYNQSLHRNMSFNSGNLSRFPVNTLPTPVSAPKTPKLNVLTSFMGFRKKKLPNTHDMKSALDKLKKLAKKAQKQQEEVLNIFQAWGTGLPDSVSRELVVNMFNMLLGPLNIGKDLGEKLSSIGTHLDELSQLEDLRAHLESELVNTQKLFHRASYKGYPAHQLQSYQVTYDTFRNEFDEVTLRYRNKLVMVLKQSLQMIFASMHDQGESELDCASLGFRLLTAFDSEPKHVVQSSIYQPLRYYTPALAPAVNEDTPDSPDNNDKPCEHCEQCQRAAAQQAAQAQAQADAQAEEASPEELSEPNNKPATRAGSERLGPSRALSPGQTKFARLSPRLSNDYKLLEGSHYTDGGHSAQDDVPIQENTRGRSLLSNAVHNSHQRGSDGAERLDNDVPQRPYSNGSVISPNPFTL